MKTLIVNYTARGDSSQTKKLLDSFLANVKNSEIETLDLTKDVPDMFLPENLSAYISRNYMGTELSPELQKSIEKMDRMANQIKNADVVVLATPMYNFSLPAAVKAWFDSVLLKGETWDMNEKGYTGLMTAKKALILMASGGNYEGKMASWEHAMSLAKIEFQFMGFDDVQGVMAQGMNANPDKADDVIEKGKTQINELIKKWYI